MADHALRLLEQVRERAMPFGHVECKGAWLRQEGEMRFTPDGPWLPFTAEQTFQGRGIDFRWNAKVRMAPFVSARVLDSFEGGRGTLIAKLFGLVTVASSSGAATDKGEALRGLAELPWRPFAFWDAPFFTWESPEPSLLRANFDDRRIRVVADFQVDGEGQILGGTAAARPRMVGKDVVDTPWSGIFGEYKLFEGTRVPTVAEARWHLTEGPFTYWRGRVKEFRIVR